MAKKKRARTPPPPRRTEGAKRPVQAPRPRGARAAREPGGGSETRLRVLAATGVLIVAGLAVGLGLGLGGGDDDRSAVNLSSSGCTPRTLEEQGREHATVLPADFAYNSFPPTSGFHNPRPAIYNLYTEPVPQMLLVHNLEHGAVVVQYGDRVAQSDLERLRAWYAADPVGLVVAPLPALGDKVAATAWTQLLTCTGFGEQAIASFTEAYRYQGPERFSPETMQPGT